jgi:hypothetical protein
MNDPEAPAPFITARVASGLQGSTAQDYPAGAAPGSAAQMETYTAPELAEEPELATEE